MDQIGTRVRIFLLFRRRGLSINIVWRPLGLCNRRQCRNGICLSRSSDRPPGSPPSTATTDVPIALARLAVLLLFVAFKHTSVRCSFHVQYVFKLSLSSIVLCSCLYVAFFFVQLLEVLCILAVALFSALAVPC